MTLIGVLVLVILAVLLMWIVAQSGMTQTYRSIIVGVLIVIILIALLHSLGLFPHGRLVIE